MDITIDPLSSIPIYQQIRDRIVAAVASGRLRRGDSLLSVRQLASAFAVNPGTVVKAYDLLRSEGVVATNAKSGTFIADDRDSAVPTPAFRADFTSRLTTLLAEGRARGLSDADLRVICDSAANSLNTPQEHR